MKYLISVQMPFLKATLLGSVLCMLLSALTLVAQQQKRHIIREPQAAEILRSLDSLLLLPSDTSLAKLASDNNLRGSLKTRLAEYHRRLDEWNRFKDSLRVEITTPITDTITVVSKRSVIVKGHVSSPNVEVWLLVRWQKSPYYWVQPRAAISPDGTWQASIYAGSEAKNSGHIFEIRAFAGLQAPLELGQILFTWPEALAQSKTVMVKRK